MSNLLPYIVIGVFALGFLGTIFGGGKVWSLMAYFGGAILSIIIYKRK